MVWLDPEPIDNDKDDWKVIEEKKYIVLEHLENFQSSNDGIAESESKQSESPFCYRVILKAKNNKFLVGIARSFPEMRKDWQLVDDQLKQSLQELDVINAKKLKDNDITKEEIEQDLNRYLLTKFISLALQQGGSASYKQAYANEKELRKKVTKPSMFNSIRLNRNLSRRKSLIKSPSAGITKLRDLLADNNGVTYFLQFLIQEKLDQHNLNFWMDIQSFKKQSGNSRIDNSKKIYERYILVVDPTHPLEKELRDEITPEKVHSPSEDLYDMVETSIVDAIFLNSFPKFLIHPLYQKYTLKIQEKTQND